MRHAVFYIFTLGLAAASITGCTYDNINTLGIANGAAIPDEMYVSIPDANFRQKLADQYNIKANAAGAVAYSRIKDITHLNFNLDEKGDPKNIPKITDFTGIEYFTSLKDLEAKFNGEDNPAMVWDFSKNKNLERLRLSYSNFNGKLILGNLSKLRTLWLIGLKLAAFEADSFPVLEEADIQWTTNTLSHFPFSQAPQLKNLWLAAAADGVFSIDLSKNFALEGLFMNYKGHRWHGMRRDLQTVYVSAAQKAELDKADGGRLSQWVSPRNFGSGQLFPKNKPQDFNLKYTAQP